MHVYQKFPDRSIAVHTSRRGLSIHVVQLKKESVEVEFVKKRAKSAAVKQRSINYTEPSADAACPFNH